MGDETNELLKELLKGQKKILASFEAEKKKVRELEGKIAQLELQIHNQDSRPYSLSPALVRALTAMIELQEPCSTEELAIHLGLSRNVVSLYLNQLERIGFVDRHPYLAKEKITIEREGKEIEYYPRYLFNINNEQIPDDLRDFLSTKKS